MTTDKKGERITAVWRNGGFGASYDSFVVKQTVVLRINGSAIIPPLRQAAKRCGQVLQHRTNGKAVFFGGKQATLRLSH